MTIKINDRRAFLWALQVKGFEFKRVDHRYRLITFHDFEARNGFELRLVANRVAYEVLT